MLYDSIYNIHISVYLSLYPSIYADRKQEASKVTYSLGWRKGLMVYENEQEGNFGGGEMFYILTGVVIT